MGRKKSDWGDDSNLDSTEKKIKNNTNKTTTDKEPESVKEPEVIDAEIVQDAPDPFDAPPIERDYASGKFEYGSSQKALGEAEQDIPEAKFDPIKGEYNLEGDTPQNKEEEKEERSFNPAAKDLSNSQKKKAAEQLADFLLVNYCNLAPIPFKKWASFSDLKVNQLVSEDKLNLDMKLNNNMNVGEYIKETNNEINKIFEVSEETKESIREPLVEVLLEQEMVLTPTQRLLMAVGGHIVTMGVNCYQLNASNKEALAQFQQFHKERKEAPPVQQRPVTQQHEQDQQPTTKAVVKDEKPAMDDILEAE